ncbi:hypothetical protein ACF0H5_022215 [Mactra antiquata]
MQNKTQLRIKKRRNPIIYTDFVIVTRDYSLLMYSAYIDKRDTFVRVIGVIRKDVKDVKCLLYYNNSTNRETVKARIKLLPEDHKVEHTAAFILCPIRTVIEPDKVTLVIPDFKTNLYPAPITIQKTRQRVWQYKYTLCVSPVHSNYNNRLKLIEWIEMNLLLGADNIIFYVQNVSESVMLVLRYYELFGVVTVYHWTLPVFFTDLHDRHLHYFGQVAAVNDCVYKAKYVSEYVTTFDLDEFIIPQLRHHWSWADMMATVPKRSVYMFLCNFFHENPRCQAINCTDKLSLSTFIIKDNIVLPPRKRSKYIARSNDIIMAGIHQIWNTTSGRVNYVVNPRVGLLHHYRQNKKVYTTEHVTSSRSHVTLKYFHQIKERVRDVEKYLQPFLGDVYSNIELV